MYVAYHTNHPLYTPPNPLQFYVAAAAFVLCELGNLSIHVALKNLRPPGTTVRKIPMPTSNPFTRLFDLVSCPNYTYEIGSWIAFTIMTSCLPGTSAARQKSHARILDPRPYANETMLIESRSSHFQPVYSRSPVRIR